MVGSMTAKTDKWQQELSGAFAATSVMEQTLIDKFASGLLIMKVAAQSRREHVRVERQERRHKQLEGDAGGY